MNLERITNVDNHMYLQAVELYKISFPEHEQRERLSQENILKDKAYHFDLIYDEDTFVGIILYWEIGGYFYIEHFCILPEMRNKHYGERTLDLLKERGLILEIDPPVDDISIRRKGFYERCGFVKNQYSHIYPPYHIGNSGHELIVMSRPNKLTDAEYNEFNSVLKDVIMKDAF